MERAPRLWFDADVVVHSPANPLLAAEIAFCCLHGKATEKELDLIHDRQQAARTLTHISLRP
jgi:hypothetical protein